MAAPRSHGATAGFIMPFVGAIACRLSKIRDLDFKTGYNCNIRTALQ